MNYKKLVIGGLWFCGLLLINQSEKDMCEVNATKTVVATTQEPIINKNKDGINQLFAVTDKPSLPPCIKKSNTSC